MRSEEKPKQPLRAERVMTQKWIAERWEIGCVRLCKSSLVSSTKSGQKRPVNMTISRPVHVHEHGERFRRFNLVRASINLAALRCNRFAGGKTA